MIIRTVGKLRNIYKNRELILKLVKQITKSQNLMVLDTTDNFFTMVNLVDDPAMTIVMLGRSMAMTYDAAKAVDPNITAEGYVQQIMIVALTHLDKEGKIK